MNTHLNLVTEREQLLAETLRSLSGAPASEPSLPPEPRVRRPGFYLGLLLLGTATGVLALQPDAMRDIRAMVFDISPSSTTSIDKGVQPSAPAISAPAGEITGSGFVIAPRTATIFSKYEGTITDVAVEVGDDVSAGQVLVILDDAAARFALDRAREAGTAAALQRAARMIDLRQARTALDRTQRLADANVIAEKALDEARLRFDQASNAVEQAQQGLESADLSIRIARERLDALIVRAPFAGTVTRLDARMGDTVLARLDSVRESQSLLQVTDRTRLVIDADIAEGNLAPLRPGMTGEAILDGFPDRPFPVEVLRLAPIASAEKGTVALRLSLAHPPDGTRPNMAARIRIPLTTNGDMSP
jgi:RND family efflux transporter MFP subunit